MKNSPAEITDYRRNSLQLVKYLAAFSVMWGHMVAHYGLNVPEWINRAVSFFSGVPLFFAISGFTIWLSLERDSGIRRYFTNRFFRVYPELWLGVFVSVLSIIILYPPVRSSLAGAGYLASFTVTQGSFFQFWTPGILRGFGVGTPNGSLWTICTLIQFYLIAILFYRFIKNRKIYWWFIFAGISVGANLLKPVLKNVLPETVYKLYLQLLPVYFWIFCAGMFIARYRERIVPFLAKFWWGFLALAAVLHLTRWDLTFSYPFFTTLLLITGMTGFAYALPGVGTGFDLTYGIYIYHMIVVNIFVHTGITGTYWLLPVTVAITALCAAGSTAFGKLIRKRCGTKRIESGSQRK